MSYATDGLSIYGMFSPSGPPDLALRLVRVPMDGGPIVDLYDTAAPGGPVALDDHCVYWMENLGIWSQAK
jgi:hypothetical protein